MLVEGKLTVNNCFCLQCTLFLPSYADINCAHVPNTCFICFLFLRLLYNMIIHWRSDIASLHTSKALFALNKSFYYVEKEKKKRERLLKYITSYYTKLSRAQKRGIIETFCQNTEDTFFVFFFAASVSVSCLICLSFFHQGLFSPTCFSYASQYISRYESQGEGTVYACRHPTCIKQDHFDI